MTIMDKSDLDILLPFSCHIESIGAKREMSPKGPYAHRYITVTLRFQNTVVEVDIQEEDPRYETIKDHLISVGRWQGTTE